MKPKLNSLLKPLLALTTCLVLGNVAQATPIPSPLNIWVLDNTNVTPAELPSVAGNYAELLNRTEQHFHFFVGDNNLRGNGTVSARIEVSGGLAWSPSPAFHEFDATCNMTSAHSQSVCIAQIFNYTESHPEMQLRFESNGNLVFEDHGAHTIVDNNPGNIVPANGVLGSGLSGKNFNIRIRSNGWWQEVYLNGTKVYAHVPYTSSTSANLGFRWGVYANETIDGPVDLLYFNMVRQ